MAMTNEQLTKWIDEIFGTIDEIKVNSGDISGLTQSVRQLRLDLTATQGDVSDLEDQTAGTESMAKAPLQHFTDGSAIQALDLVADIIPVQAGTGDPSPTNVRAITGYSSVVATAAGKNLINVEDQSGTSSNNYYVELSMNYQLKPGVTYTFSAVLTSSAGNFDVLIGAGPNYFSKTIATKSNCVSGDRISVSFTPTESNLSDGSILFIRAPRYATSTGEVFTYTMSDIQLEYGETATPYTAPDINTATISLGSTVYGGNVNFINGNLNTTYGSLDPTTATWTANNSGENAYEIVCDTGNKEVGYDNFMSNKFNYSAWNFTDVAEYSIRGFGNNAKLAVKFPKSVVDSVEDAVQWFSDNATQIIYPLATPTTTTLTPAQLSLLQGENNVSATSGPITLTYAPDNVLAEIYFYIQNNIIRINSAISALDTRVYALEHPTTTNTRKTTKTLTKKED